MTRLVGCRLPIQLAGMPRIAVPALVAAVCNAGARRMAGGARYRPARLVADLDAPAVATDGPFGVTYLAPFPKRGPLDVAAARARVVELA
jgi:enoyl-[acyl-carrier protein] reductase II